MVETTLAVCHPNFGSCHWRFDSILGDWKLVGIILYIVHMEHNKASQRDQKTAASLWLLAPCWRRYVSQAT